MTAFLIDDAILHGIVYIVKFSIISIRFKQYFLFWIPNQVGNEIKVTTGILIRFPEKPASFNFSAMVLRFDFSHLISIIQY